MKIWSESRPEAFASIIVQAIAQMDDLDQRQEYSSEVFIDYMTLLASDIIKEKKDGAVQNGFWNPNQGIADNLMREHMPYTYISWVFSDNPEESLYHGPDIARRVYIYGDVDVEIWKDGKMLQGIDRKGREYAPDLPVEEEYEDDFDFSYILLIRNGTETLTSLPYNENYQIRIRTGGDEYIQVFDLYSLPYQTFGIMDDIDFIYVSKGEYLLDFSTNTDEFTIEPIEGEVINRLSVPYQYSPTMIMAAESDAVKHLTIPGLLALIFWVLVVVTAVLLVCLVIAIVHKIRKKKHGKSYSPWFVIIPHLFIAAFFTVLTEFCTMHMFLVTMARVVCALVTMAVICLLSLRGLIRNRCIRNVVILAILAAAAVVNVAVYQRSALASSETSTLVIYCICIAGLCVLAVSTFFGRKHPKQFVDTDLQTGSAQES